MLRHTNSTRSSIRSVPLDHLDPYVASRDAHIAATHAFSRARERTSNNSDNSFPITARPLESDMSSSTGGRSQQSVRFVGPSAGVRSRQNTNRTSMSSDVGTPESVETLKPGNIPPASTIDAECLKPPDLPSLGTGPPTRNYIGRSGITSSATNLDPDDTAALSPSALYIRRSKSLFAQGNQGSAGRATGEGAPSASALDIRPNAGGGDRKAFGLHSLRATRSNNILDGSRDQLSLSHEEQVRELAVKLARDRWNRSELDSLSPGKHKSRHNYHYYHHHLPSIFFRSNSTKDMKESLRPGGQSQADLPLSLSHHDSPHEASLRHKARKASHSFRNKLRNIFKPTTGSSEENGLPDQHVESRRTHVKDTDNTSDTPNGSIVKLRYSHNAGSVSRVASSIVSLVDVPEHQAMRSRQGSIDELENHHIVDDKSRVTSWTSSGVTASSGQSGDTWSEWEKHRHPALRDGGSHQPPSPLASPGFIVDSQRVYSALIKRLDETRQLGRIEEQKGLEGSPLTIRPISTGVDDEDNVFTSPPISGRRLSTSSPVPSIRSVANSNDHEDGRKSSIYPISHLDHVQPPPKIMANRQSAFFGSPTCHLFRTESPYRRALQKSIKDEEDALRSQQERKSTLGKLPLGLTVEIPTEENQDQESDFYDSPSVYSTNSPVREDAPSIPEDMPGSSRSSHGEATIYLNPPTYCPRVQDKGRLVSNASSVEWKSWLSSHVSKLEHESPTRSSPNLGADIYSPAAMSPSFICPTRHVAEHAELGPRESNTPQALTPRPLRTRIAGRGGNAPLGSTSGNIPTSSPTPRRPPPTPPVPKVQCSLGSNDENTPPESQKRTASISPPPIPVKSPLRKISSPASIPRYVSRSPTPTKLAPLRIRCGSAASRTPVRDRSLHSMRSCSGFNQPRMFSGERKVSDRVSRQPTRGRLTSILSCASTPGFPLILDGQLAVGKNRPNTARASSQDGNFKSGNRDYSPNTTPVRRMAFIPGGSREMVEAFLSERRKRMVSSGEKNAFV